MTDSESHSLSEKGSRNSATYSIHSLDDVPVRKSAVQIIRERSTDMFHHQNTPGSPRKPRATMQITKLVLKDPPASPSRRKITPVVIKSIQTYTSSALTGACGQEENRKKSGGCRPQEEFKIIPLLNAGQLLEQFEAKKNERNAASSEFQNYLVESFNKENRERAAIQISKQSTPSDDSTANLIAAPEEHQGKSDNSSSATTKTSSTTATSSSHAATAPSGAGKSSSKTTTTGSSSTSSSEVPPPPPPVVADKMPPKPTVRRTSRPRTQPEPAVPEARKEKSYDPQRAREYIKEQQAKRKQEKRSSGPPACEKELIRKRLEDLKKNTQVLVNKNVQKARKRSLSATPGGGGGGSSSQKSSTPLRALESGGSGRGMAPQKPLRKSVSTSSLRVVVTPASGSAKSSVASSTRRRSSLLKADLSEKMGIMRKPDDVPLGDVLVSPLRMVTPPSPPRFDHRVDELGMMLMETNGEERDRSRSFLELEKELKLEVPEVTLVPDSVAKINGQPVEPVVSKNDRPQQIRSIPPWLKHTLIQPDPYPFIVAVRKKLEAACNRPAEPPATGKSKDIKSSKRCHEYLQTLKSVPYINKPSKAGSREQPQNNASSISHQTVAPNTTSDISSIRSDFVLSMPPLSSTKIDTNDTLTSSVQQPQVSPLSVDRISNLKITAADSSLQKVNFSRGDDMPNAELIPDRVSFSARHVVDLNESQLSLNTSEKQRNFLNNTSDKTTNEYQRMLEAFNRSLSHVIEVNQQLYSTLRQPGAEDRIKIRDEMTQTTPQTVNGSSSNYTDDFERSGAAVQKSDFASSADSTPQKSSSFTTTTSSTEPTTTSSSSGESPSSKTNSSESEQQLLDSRSFASLSDSHNTTHPPMPDEYLPSFEESLRRQEVVPVATSKDKSDEPVSERGTYSGISSNIETQISDEVRDEVRAVKSVESISMKFAVESEVANEDRVLSSSSSSKVEVLKKPVTSSSSNSELEALSRGVGVDSEREEDQRMNDTTMGSDILAIFNRTDLEISVMSTTVSEANLSYSSIGLYDQLIQSEKSKTDQLASRARLKEKALLDRTKGQLAWLELQKQRYRERGMIEQISTTKKKQRAILVRLERERAELNKFKKVTVEVPSRSAGSRSPHRSIEKLNSFSSASNSISLRKSATGSGRSEIGSPQLVQQQQQQRKLTATTTTTTTTMLATSMAAVRGVELEPSESLEDILQRREQELQKRRQHVQALLEWHRKLDEEEQQIREIERNLLQYNRGKMAEVVAEEPNSSDTSVALGRIRSIEASLQTLAQIPNQQQQQKQQLVDKTSSDEEVRASGSKLNRLWYRLTGVKEARYDTTRSYTLTKANLERLYEEAKAKVLEGFRSGGGTLLDQSLSGINSTQGSVGNVSVIERKEDEVEVEVASSDASSFKTTVTSSEVLVAEKDQESSQQEEASSVNEAEVLEEDEDEDLPDVDEIISRVSDITDNMNDLLSSTTKQDEMQMQNQQDRPVSESIEFHTTIDDEEGEEGQDSTGQNHYSTSFDASTIEEQPQHVLEVVIPTANNDSQLMIEDTSLPPLMDDSIVESLPEMTDKIATTSETSLDEKASSGASTATTRTTAEETETEFNEVVPAATAPLVVASELEKRLVQLNDKLGELSDSFERVPLMRSPDRQISSDSSEPCSSSTVEEDFLGNNLNSKAEPTPEDPKIEIKIRTKTSHENFPNPALAASPPSSPTSAPPVFTSTANRMPDIINEAEVLRRQELQIEQEIKQLEQQVVFLREIPNKPPPPYIPPANGSPLALIFPSEQRIDELIEDRTRDLFRSTSPDEDSLTSDHVTNIYEKLILDMCKELFTDLRAPTPDVSFRTVKHDKRPLAFYNPPDQLRCLQRHMKRKIKKILNEETLAQQQNATLHHCPMPFLMYGGAAGGAGGIGGAKRKRDQVDEILAQEMFDEEPRWTNFDREEIEVKERIVEELTKMLVSDALQDMEGAWRERLSLGEA